MKGYERKLEKAKKSGLGLHRGAKITESQRFIKKILEKSNWYKKKKCVDEEEEKNYETHYRGAFAPKNEGKGPRGVKNKTGNKSKDDKNKDPLTVLFVKKTPAGDLAK